MKTLQILVAFGCFLLTSHCVAFDIYFYGGNAPSYQYEMLQHALSYDEQKKYRVKIYGGDVSKDRAFTLLEKSDFLQVVFGGASEEREAKYLPVRIPLFKGLNSWRVALVKQGNTDLFTNLPPHKNFKRLLAGQFYAWSDTPILESNGINLYKSNSPHVLADMLAKGRIDYFPRSVLEVWNDLERYKDLPLSVEPHTYIHYPSAYYFYVGRRNAYLANDIKQGLLKAIEDGSFERIFNKHHGDAIKKAQSTQRRTLYIANPFLPSSAPLEQTHFWMNLDQQAER